MSTPEPAPPTTPPTAPRDELEARIRSLEAERLRPVPPPAMALQRPIPLEDAVAARLLLDELAEHDDEDGEA